MRRTERTVIKCLFTNFVRRSVTALFSMGIYDLVKIYVGKKFETKHDRAVNPILIGCNIYLRSNKE